MKLTRMVRRTAGAYNLNTYILICTQTREAVIIDPGGPSTDLTALLDEEKITPKIILHTHGHADPVFSVPEFKKKHDIPSCLHKADDLFFKDPGIREKTFRAVGLPAPYPADIQLSHGDWMPFGRSGVKVVHTPGHTPGSVCFLCEDHLFTGDAIFVGEAGRTDLPGGDLDQLIDSIRNRILPMDKDTVILPGHHHTGDAAHSTIGREMKENIYITDFILDP